MSDLPVPRADVVPSPELATEHVQRALSSAADYARAEKAEATRRAYRADFAHFAAWCERASASALPASIETVAAYLASLADAGLRASTISRRKAAIGYAHRLKGLEPPTNAEPVKAVLRGIRRRIGVAVERKAPATARAIARMLKRIPDTLAGKRDRALLLIGFAAALRRSELVALDVPDLEITAAGAVVMIRQSKTDQEGEGAQIAVPRGTKLKPVEALEAWLAAASIEEGPVFRPIAKGGRIVAARLTDRSVADVVKRRARAGGLDPEIFSGHSLRAGFVTSALENGADVLKVMDVTRHKSVDTLKGYDRRAKAFRDHAGKRFL
jgi:site-specific recombinase XerD